MSKKYTYMISFEPNENLFKEMCTRIEKVNRIKKGELLEDVDGSLYQEYHCDDGNFEVCNDCYFDNEVRIDSDFELEKYLGNSWFLRKIAR